MSAMDDVVSLSIAQMRRLSQAKNREEIELEVERARALSSAAMGAIGATNAQLGVVRTYMQAGASADAVERRFGRLLGAPDNDR